MAFILWLTTAVLIIHASNSYILLTANLEDVQALAKQLASSPVGDQLTKMWRRAANQFNAQVQNTKRTPAFDPEFQRRAELEGDETLSMAAEPQQPFAEIRTEEITNDEVLNDNNQVERRSQDDEDVVALGRNASLYLKSIRKIFEKV